MTGLKMNGLKDTLTTIVGVVLVVAVAVETYLASLCATCTVEFLPLAIASTNGSLHSIRL